MSGYRADGVRRDPRSEPSERPNARLFLGLLAAVVMVSALAYFFWKASSHAHRDAPVLVAETDAGTVIPSTVVAVVPDVARATLSEQSHLALVAAISIANTATTVNRDDLARAAMAMAAVVTDDHASCGDYDVAFSTLRKAMLATDNASVLPDLTAELAEIEHARCDPGSDAGG